jgi:hypothetical protein
VAEIYPVSVSKAKLVSNRIPFAFDLLPECGEQEPNDSESTAQLLELPIMVNGRIAQPGDHDIFAFRGSAEQQIVAEVYARRLDSPLDSVLKLTDAGGHQIAFNDDHEDKGSGLNTHHADSYIMTTLTNAAIFYLHLSDAQRQGGESYAYRLRISGSQPDFALRVAPSSINVRAGLSVPITVYALRKDGFTNEISLALDQGPAGLSLGGARIPANQDQVRLTLSATSIPPTNPATISIEGRAMINGRRVSHAAVPAEDMMQAFAYHHLVPAKELKVAVIGRGMLRGGLRLLGPTPVRIPAGGTARVRIAGPAAVLSDRFDLDLADPPEGISLEKKNPTSDGTELVFQSDVSKTRARLQGNLIVSIVSGNARAQKTKKQANQRRVVVGTLPAIPFEVVPQ